MAEAPQRLRVFLCHSSSDKRPVRVLYHLLSVDDIEPWLDEKNLIGGEKWELKIRNAVRNSHVVIVCLTKGAINKTGFVQKEIRYALDMADEQPENTIFIIPIRLEPCDIPERLRQWHCINMYEEGSYERLMKSLQQRADTLKNNIQPSANVSHHSTFTLTKIPQPNNFSEQLFEQELKAYKSVSPASSWKFISALLILLLVTIFLLPNPPSSLDPTLDYKFPADGIEIYNTNDYPIVKLEAYLTAYKFEKVRLEMIERSSEVKVSHLVSRELGPEQVTKILTRNLKPYVESTQTEVPPNSNEFIIWALVITFHRIIIEKQDGKQVVKIDRETLVKIRPFSAPVIDGQRAIFPPDPQKNTIIVDGVSYNLTDIMRGIERK